MTSTSDSSNLSIDWELIPKLCGTCEAITLRDLLDSAIFGPWTMSAICNGINHSEYLEEEPSAEDQLLEYKVYQITRTIPYSVRRAMFAETSELVKLNKETRHSQGRN